MSDIVYDLADHDVQTYRPPGPVGAAFLRDRENFVRMIMGPFGSGKTNAMIFDALTCAARMPVCKDGKRHYRHIFLRDTYQNMWSTMIPSWWSWYPKNLGLWHGTEGRRAEHRLTFDQPDGSKLEAEFLFIALQDERIENVLRGIEFTQASLNEADLMSSEVLPYVLGRALQKRFPPLRLLQEKDISRDAAGEPTAQYHVGVTGDLNPPDVDSWIYNVFEEERPYGHILYKQPSGRSPMGENRQGVSAEAYEQSAKGNAHRPWWVRRMVDGLYGYSRDGEPVYPEFDDERHVAADDLKPLPSLPLRLGFDQGVTGPAMIVSQFTYEGQLRILDELVPGRMGPTRFGQLCRILLNERYAGFAVRAAAADPAAFYGGDKEGGDLAWAETVAEQLNVALLPAPSQELNIRTDAVAQLLRHWIAPRVPALIVSPTCLHLRKGFNSHYRYKVKGEGNARQIDPKPEKNWWSNPHDALQYLVLDIFGLDGVIAGAPGTGAGAQVSGRGADGDEDLPRRAGNVIWADFDVFKV